MAVDILIQDSSNNNIVHQHANEYPRKSWADFLIGRPLATADAHNRTIGKAIGLAVFASMRSHPRRMLPRRSW